MTITITTPASFQMYQRDADNVADIPITGTYSGSPTAIEARYGNGAWVVIDAAPSGGTYSGTLSDQEAGYLAVHVRFANDINDTTFNPFVGIGDVFLVIGQSNAAGYGAGSEQSFDPTGTDGVYPTMFRAHLGAWEVLDDDPTGDSGSSGSPWPLFATHFVLDQGVPCGIINAAIGGGRLVGGPWSQGGSFYNGALAALTASGVNGVKAMLWHQGESEAQTPSTHPQSDYETALSTLLDDLQADSALLAGVKMVVAQIGDVQSYDRSQVDPILKAQATRWASDPDILVGPVTYDINLNDGDTIHFGSGTDGDTELETLAGRWWRMVGYHFYETRQGRGPRFVSAERSGNQVTVTLSASVLPLVGQTDTTGWRYTDNGAVINVNSAAALGANAVVLTLASTPSGAGDERVIFGSGEDAHDTTLMDSGAYPLPPEPFDEAVTVATTGLVRSPAAFFLDIEDSVGNRLGSGPIVSVQRWTYTARFDRAGSIGFAMPATDPQASLITNRRVARAYALVNDQWAEVGAGVIDNVQKAPAQDGRVTLLASGMDLIRELAYRNVGALEIGLGTGASHATAISVIGGYAPDNWQFLTANDPGNDYIYARYDGESVLAALVYLADKTQTHFYRSSGRILRFASAFVDSGVHAIQATGELSANTCAVVSLRRTIDTADLLTRITPYGSGQGDTRLTLAATNRTAPTGYTLSRTQNYIENDVATAAYGLIDHPQFEFKEITPISNTNADFREAANMLFDSALEELRQRSTLADQVTYEIAVAGCSQLLRPLQTLRLTYRDVDQGIEIDDDLYILESTWEADASGVRTSRLVVSTDDRWPASDAEHAAERAAQGRVFQAHPQIGPNEWWENAVLYIGIDEADHVAEFPFVLGRAVVTVQQVVMRFKVAQILAATFRYEQDATATDANTSPANTGLTAAGDTVSGGGGTSGDTSLTVTTDPAFPTVVNGSTTTTTSTSPDSQTDVKTGQVATTSVDYGASAPLHTHPVDTHSHDFAHTHGTDTHYHDALTEHTHVVDPNPHQHTTPNHVHSITATHAHTTAAHSHGLPALLETFGLYRAAASGTYALDELEYAVNGGDWVSLDEASATGDGYYELDLTEDVTDPDVPFRPAQESGNNLIEIRSKEAPGSSTLIITAIQGDLSDARIVVQTTTPHGLVMGDIVLVTGTTGLDGTRTVIGVFDTTTFYLSYSGGDTAVQTAGSIKIGKTAMIYAKLGVRTTIQGVAVI